MQTHFLGSLGRDLFDSRRNLRDPDFRRDYEDNNGMTGIKKRGTAPFFIDYLGRRSGTEM